MNKNSLSDQADPNQVTNEAITSILRLEEEVFEALTEVKNKIDGLVEGTNNLVNALHAVTLFQKKSQQLEALYYETDTQIQKRRLRSVQKNVMLAEILLQTLQILTPDLFQHPKTFQMLKVTSGLVAEWLRTEELMVTVSQYLTSFVSKTE